jgi:glycosyltransferase involved in cell wall biosynthesis
MKLLICCNHCWNHIGGSEIISKTIAEKMSNEFAYDVFVINGTVGSGSVIKHKGVSYIQIPAAEDQFIHQIQRINPDYMFVYSDFFVHFPSILRNIDKIRFPIGIALVGMNAMLSSNKMFLLADFVKKKSRFDVIVHSDHYQDFDKCKKLNIPVTVIPNGVDMNEFANNNIHFRDKYDIKSKYVLLCVSNFFPGKGQDFLINVFDRLSTMSLDFTGVFVCSTVNFQLANTMRQIFIRNIQKKSFASKVLLDIPREDVVSAFKNSDVFVFPSQKEVAPLVILEAMAASLPWVSLPVGNVPELKGGLIIQKTTKGGLNTDGYLKYTDETYDEFAGNVKTILENGSIRKELSDAGLKEVKDKYNWDVIIPQYRSLFEKNNS